MIIRIGKHRIQTNKLDNEKYNISPFTDKEIHTFSMTINVSNNKKEEFDYAISKNDVFRIDDNGNDICQYKVKNNYCSYIGSEHNENTIYTYNLSFKQVDKLELEALIFSGLTLYPYYYEESYDDGVIIEAKVKVTKEELETINSLQDNHDNYFEVLRQGINDKILSMRFGKTIWSEHESFYKINLILVEKSYDDIDNQRADLFQPELYNMKDKVANLSAFSDELVRLLISKEILSKEDVDVIKGNINNRFNDEYRKLYKVTDIDEY